MSATGRCHCGAVTWAAEGEPQHHAICHCEDCRRWSGAPMVGWIAWQEDQLTVEGAMTRYHSSRHGTREFCSACGTGLFYRNPETLPGIVDIQSGTLDDPEGLPPGAQVMVKERLGWAPGIADLPAFNAYPGMD
ncbi:GFA family protein [uncultured Sphingomonas sp.]|uniref:GFA family protein n=1 Tax=uncultured Sphingomonas sp. TaxID=158754 RepID=UPI0025D9B175|nr:GFA family protein [uncultured Sphingomonas sp.]